MGSWWGTHKGGTQEHVSRVDLGLPGIPDICIVSCGTGNVGSHLREEVGVSKECVLTIVSSDLFRAHFEIAILGTSG